MSGHCEIGGETFDRWEIEELEDVTWPGRRCRVGTLRAVGAWTRIALIGAATALAVGLFPTMRAMVNGSASQPAVASATTSSPVGPLTAASQASDRAPAGAVRVLLVGNSVAKLLAPGFATVRANAPVAVLDESVEGCGFPPELGDVRITLPSGRMVPEPPCDPAWEAGVVARFHPRIVFWILSGPLGADGTYRGRRVRPCDASYDALYKNRLKREVAVLGAGGARVVIATAAYSRYLGVSKFDRGTDCQNGVRRSVAAATGAQLVDLFGYVCPDGRCRAKQDGVTLRPDGLHYSGAGGAIVAQWMFDQVRQ
jgi:hypothetical protein